MNDGQLDDDVQKVGPYLLRKVKPGPTTAGIDPTYALCTPDRWGMRYSDRDPKRPGQLAYPLAREYARTMVSILHDCVQWGNAYYGPKGATPTLILGWPIDQSQADRLFDLLKPAMIAPLTSELGGFGLPPEAAPAIVKYKPSDFGEQGLFSPGRWQMKLTFDNLKDLFDLKSASEDPAERTRETHWIRELADTIYHESRHCQQYFWMYALIMQHPDNFESMRFISQWPKLGCVSDGMQNSFASGVVDLATRTALPDDAAALISLKRMAVGMYFQNLFLWREVGYRAPYMRDEVDFNHEYNSARDAAIKLLQHVGLGGTSIDVDQMVKEPWTCRHHYSERPWENDAFFCGDMATAYWSEATGLQLYTHQADQCSRTYEFDYTHDLAGFRRSQ
jgi:hypothetical protein